MTPESEATGSYETSSEPLELSIVIPSYLEGENLPYLLPLIKQAAAKLTPHFEVLIIDTEADMDNTRAACEAEGVRHVNRTGGNSYGDALRTGIALACGEYLLSMDADGSHDPDYYASMWAKRGSADIVIGSRYAPGGQTENPAVLIWMSYVLNLTFRIAFSIRARDITTSFRLYRRSILLPLRLESNDFDILEELLIKAVIRKPPARIAEVPIIFKRRKAGESKRKLVQFAFGYLATLRKLQKFRKDALQEMQTGRPA